MRFITTPLVGAYTIELEGKGDERGFFARFFCKKEFEQLSLATDFVQINNSLSAKKGTLRGMHYQLPPASEVKLIRCIQGALYDAIIDIRPDSPTYRQWFGVELTSNNRKMLYVPQGFAHGFITLEDNTELLYLVSSYYEPQAERGIRYNDPLFAIDWPVEPVVVSDKDRNWPDFNPAWHLNDAMEGLV
ncbi:dTDP-4-dehydrorhamnose 3,5-epimerase [Candidatus Thiomargarita nelsonii]|uniref:dTDP-4-dehydrorhamnose 3,5-epimerase n=1 Tax=Candidatus Thiomargarita nelsonii TaxID=1003181 RepID=A0A0A6RPI4_9GAMM|nr:dTDP-4-dehydrorhamnose 3,5-epimerase [Candidatus Thiomargarita nelsonii]